jgi:hypothetical protein
MLRRLLRSPRADVEVGVAIPIGCLVPLAALLGVAIAVGVVVGTRLATPEPPRTVAVRVIDDGAGGGPRVVSTQIVPLR